jgi:hypothetical protein
LHWCSQVSVCWYSPMLHCHKPWSHSETTSPRSRTPATTARSTGAVLGSSQARATAPHQAACRLQRATDASVDRETACASEVKEGTSPITVPHEQRTSTTLYQRRCRSAIGARPRVRYRGASPCRSRATADRRGPLSRHSTLQDRRRHRQQRSTSVLTWVPTRSCGSVDPAPVSTAISTSTLSR